MTHIFQNITWLRYFELLAFALAAYYLHLGVHWYRAEITRLFRTGGSSSVTDQQRPLLAETSDIRELDSSADSQQTVKMHEHESLREEDLLATALLAAIAESSGGLLEPIAVAQKLKAVLLGYPGLGRSPHRAAINRLIVAECKKAGIAQLSESEVDGWWQG
jgi:hypothetical protein